MADKVPMKLGSVPATIIIVSSVILGGLLYFATQEGQEEAEAVAPTAPAETRLAPTTDDEATESVEQPQDTADTTDQLTAVDLQPEDAVEETDLQTVTTETDASVPEQVSVAEPEEPSDDVEDTTGAVAETEVTEDAVAAPAEADEPVDTVSVVPEEVEAEEPVAVVEAAPAPAVECPSLDPGATLAEDGSCPEVAGEAEMSVDQEALEVDEPTEVVSEDTADEVPAAPSDPAVPEQVSVAEIEEPSDDVEDTTGAVAETEATEDAVAAPAEADEPVDTVSVVPEEVEAEEPVAVVEAAPAPVVECPSLDPGATLAEDGSCPEVAGEAELSVDQEALEVDEPTEVVSEDTADEVPAAPSDPAVPEQVSVAEPEEPSDDVEDMTGAVAETEATEDAVAAPAEADEPVDTVSVVPEEVEAEEPVAVVEAAPAPVVECPSLDPGATLAEDGSCTEVAGEAELSVDQEALEVDEPTEVVSEDTADEVPAAPSDPAVPEQVSVAEPEEPSDDVEDMTGAVAETEATEDAVAAPAEADEPVDTVSVVPEEVEAEEPVAVVEAAPAPAVECPSLDPGATLAEDGSCPEVAGEAEAVAPTAPAETRLAPTTDDEATESVEQPQDTADTTDQLTAVDLQPEDAVEETDLQTVTTETDASVPEQVSVAETEATEDAVAAPAEADEPVDTVSVVQEEVEAEEPVAVVEAAPEPAVECPSLDPGATLAEDGSCPEVAGEAEAVAPTAPAETRLAPTTDDEATESVEQPQDTADTTDQLTAVDLQPEDAVEETDLQTVTTETDASVPEQVSVAEPEEPSDDVEDTTGAVAETEVTEDAVAAPAEADEPVDTVSVVPEEVEAEEPVAVVEAAPAPVVECPPLDPGATLAEDGSCPEVAGEAELSVDQEALEVDEPTEVVSEDTADEVPAAPSDPAVPEQVSVAEPEEPSDDVEDTTGAVAETEVTEDAVAAPAEADEPVDTVSVVPEEVEAEEPVAVVEAAPAPAVECPSLDPGATLAEDGSCPEVAGEAEMSVDQEALEVDEPTEVVSEDTADEVPAAPSDPAVPEQVSVAEPEEPSDDVEDTTGAVAETEVTEDAVAAPAEADEPVDTVSVVPEEVEAEEPVAVVEVAPAPAVECPSLDPGATLAEDGSCPDEMVETTETGEAVDSVPEPSVALVDPARQEDLEPEAGEDVQSAGAAPEPEEGTDASAADSSIESATLSATPDPTAQEQEQTETVNIAVVDDSEQPGESGDDESIETVSGTHLTQEETPAKITESVTETVDDSGDGLIDETESAALQEVESAPLAGGTVPVVDPDAGEADVAEGTPLEMSTDQDTASVGAQLLGAPAETAGSTVASLQEIPNEEETPPVPAAVPPTFDIVRVDQFGTAIVAGRAPAGSRIEAVVDGRVASSQAVGRNGQFAMIFSIETESDTLAIGLQAALPDGQLINSEETVFVVVPHGRIAAAVADVAEGTPVDTLVSPEEPPATNLADLTDFQPSVLLANNQGVRLIQPSLPEEEDRLLVEIVSYDERGEVFIAGSTKSVGGVVNIYLDDTLVKSRQFSAGGSWWTDLAEVDAGRYRMRVEEVDLSGEVVATAEMPFQKESAQHALDLLATVSKNDADLFRGHRPGTDNQSDSSSTRLYALGHIQETVRPWQALRQHIQCKPGSD